MSGVVRMTRDRLPGEGDGQSVVLIAPSGEGHTCNRDGAFVTSPHALMTQNRVWHISLVRIVRWWTARGYEVQS